MLRIDVLLCLVIRFQNITISAFRCVPSCDLMIDMNRKRFLRIIMTYLKIHAGNRLSFIEKVSDVFFEKSIFRREDHDAIVSVKENDPLKVFRAILRGKDLPVLYDSICWAFVDSECEQLVLQLHNDKFHNSPHSK